MPESIFHVNDAEDAFPVQFWSNVREGRDDEVFTFDRAVQVVGIKTDKTDTQDRHAIAR